MLTRRTFTKLITTGAATATLTGVSTAAAKAQTEPRTGMARDEAPAQDKPSASDRPSTSGAPGWRSLGPIRQVRTELLDIAYHESGPATGPVVLLGYGWPYSPLAYAEVAPALARRGYRVLIPYLRGQGTTRFRSPNTMRSGQQAALGSDWIAFMDALKIPKAIFGGYDWGGRGLCVAAALWPERCLGLVSVNNYLVQNLSLARMPLAPSIESAQWYFYYFLTERGRNGLTTNTKELTRVVWQRNSPTWRFTEQDLDQAVSIFQNPDYVDIVLHNYRHRLLTEPGDPRYDDLESKLLTQPRITVPTVTLDGLDDGNFPPTNGTPSAKFFTGPRVHHQVPGAGHNLPQERPKAFLNAVLEVTRLRP
ncbi:alpha/beta fold hydrolase [Crossiella cryophila]|uniref:Pimeloyl-ACP methyl ester carboxylesterase n=1 Tax=Crossiella cryophila TaxID=43355 RepID=A0A7W7CEH9_9PSEU|nr:alpha/beta hydrolase [Crossiella cryophila]MBB4679705.1 pimeloyl-ACP methyl ester carboxylesterase [Crossiella cryophila]